MLSSRFAGIPISSSTIDEAGVPQLLNRGELTMSAVTGPGGRLHFGMVAGIKSVRWPTSNRNPRPDCVGIRMLRLLPAGAFAGWGSHPLESAALSRRTRIAAVGDRGLGRLDWPGSGPSVPGLSLLETQQIPRIREGGIENEC